MLQGDTWSAPAHVLEEFGHRVRVEPGVGNRAARGAGEFPVVEKGIDHDVADEADTCGVDPFADQVGLGAALCRVEAVGDLIGQDAVDFFRHLAVVAAQPGLDMGGRDAQLGRGQFIDWPLRLAHLHLVGDDDGVEEIAMDHEQAPAIGGHVLGLSADLDAAEREPDREGRAAGDDREGDERDESADHERRVRERGEPERCPAPAERDGHGEGDHDEVPPRVLVNPTLTPVGEATEMGWEGCLSVPGMRGLVPRHAALRYQGFDAVGQPIDRSVSGFHARVVQHEVDHLRGILYPMRIRDLRYFGFTDTLFPGQTLQDD